jgi:hypothetical protein
MKKHWLAYLLIAVIIILILIWAFSCSSPGISERSGAEYSASGTVAFNADKRIIGFCFSNGSIRMQKQLLEIPAGTYSYKFTVITEGGETWGEIELTSQDGNYAAKRTFGLPRLSEQKGLKAITSPAEDKSPFAVLYNDKDMSAIKDAIRAEWGAGVYVE